MNTRITNCSCDGKLIFILIADNNPDYPNLKIGAILILSIIENSNLETNNPETTNNIYSNDTNDDEIRKDLKNRAGINCDC